MEIRCELLSECKARDKFQTLYTGMIIYKHEPIVLCDEVGVPVANLKNYDALMEIIEKEYFESDIPYSENENHKFRILSINDINIKRAKESILKADLMNRE